MKSDKVPESNKLIAEINQLNIPIFEGLSPREIAAITDIGHRLDFNAGDQVIKKDNTERAIFILLAGSLEVRDGNLVVRQVLPGEIIGELAFLLSSERTVDVFAGPQGADVLSLDEITLRKRLHDKLHPEALLFFNLSKVIAQKLAGVTRNLRTMQQQLIQQEKLASLGQLTTGIAHELKNPLNFVNNFAELNNELLAELEEDLSANKEPAEGLNAAIKETLDLIKGNTEQTEKHGKRAAAIVESMMMHANQHAGKREHVDVNELVSSHVEIAYRTHKSQHPDVEISIMQDFDPGAGEILVSPQEMGRVLLNLLMNAIEAVHEQKLSNTDAYIPQVSISTKKRDEQIEICISDNGTGIAETNRDKIFEPFFTTKPTGSGIGLGLSISHEIVVQGYGGTLSLVDEGAAGATFVLMLPT